MFEPCANSSSGASASLHWNLATLREQRTDHARAQSSHNCLMRQLNPSRTNGRSTPIALKPFDLLDFLTATKRQKPGNDGNSLDSAATRLRFAARLAASGRPAPPFM
jgi:hypothetical protein